MSQNTQHVERWCFSANELKRIADGETVFACTDEVFEAWSAEPDGVCVLLNRNGKATNRYADGTVGVTADDVLAAESTDAPWHLIDGTHDVEWHNVLCDECGKFIRLFAGDAVPSSPAVDEEQRRR